MKRALVFLLSVAALVLLTAPTAVEKPLTINGRLIGNMVVIQGGVWAVSLEDFARALGAPITLEPVLSLQGNRLTVRQPSGATTEYKPQKPDGSLDAGIHFKYDIKAQKEARLAPGQFLGVGRPGDISTHVTMMNGKAWVPVSDLVRAFGDGSVRGNFSGPLQPGGLNLHINNNPNGIIAILVGL